jgi:hypothetical protein
MVLSAGLYAAEPEARKVRPDSSRVAIRGVGGADGRKRSNQSHRALVMERLLFVGRSAMCRDCPAFASIRCGSTACSLISSTAWIMYARTIGAAKPNSGITLLLPAFAAAFLGATSITPGAVQRLRHIDHGYFLVIGTTGLARRDTDHARHLRVARPVHLKRPAPGDAEEGAFIPRPIAAVGLAAYGP